MGKKSEQEAGQRRCPKCDTLMTGNDCGVCHIGYALNLADDKVRPFEDLSKPHRCGVCSTEYTGLTCGNCKIEDCSSDVYMVKVSRMNAITYMKRLYKTKWLGIKDDEKEVLVKAFKVLKKYHIYDDIKETTEEKLEDFPVKIV